MKNEIFWLHIEFGGRKKSTRLGLYDLRKRDEKMVFFLLALPGGGPPMAHARSAWFQMVASGRGMDCSSMVTSHSRYAMFSLAPGRRTFCVCANLFSLVFKRIIKRCQIECNLVNEKILTCTFYLCKLKIDEENCI